MIGDIAVKMIPHVLGGLSMLLAVGLATPVFAETITPSHVYQSVDKANTELALLHEANQSKPRSDKNAPALTERRPRHVLQKAREVLMKVQALRLINGLPEIDVPAFPVREVLPADVMKVVNRIAADVRDLRPIFGVTEPAPESALPSGKTPTDVFGNLVAAGLQVDGLGIPKSVPNAVYRVAMTIISDLEKVRAARGLADPVAMISGSSAKKPKHVFENSIQLLTQLQTLTENNADFAIPNGVVMPNDRSGKIRPGHVLDLLNNALAEISAIKVKVGATTPTELAPPQSGKTPSNVFDAVSTARAMVESLQPTS